MFWFRGLNPGTDIISDFEAGLDRIVIDPAFGMVPLEQSGADVLIDIMGQTLPVQNTGTADVQAAIVHDTLLLVWPVVGEKAFFPFLPRAGPL